MAKFSSHAGVKFLFWGWAAALVNIGVFYLLVNMRMDYKIANIVAMAAGKLTAFAVLKRFVFDACSSSIPELLREFFRFICSRLVSSFIDYCGVIICVELLLQDSFHAKIEVGIISTIINYLLSRHFVFVKKEMR